MCITVFSKRFQRAMGEERRREAERKQERAERARLELIERQDRDIDLDE